MRYIILHFQFVMRQSAFSITLCFLIFVLATFVLAIPVSESSSPNPALRLAKRSACSNGVKTNCGSASVACSGSQCTVCCGTCCQCFTGERVISMIPSLVLTTTAPRDNSCGTSTPVVNPNCSGKCGSGSTAASSTISSKSSAKSLLYRLFNIGC